MDLLSTIDLSTIDLSSTVDLSSTLDISSSLDVSSTLDFPSNLDLSAIIKDIDLATSLLGKFAHFVIKVRFAAGRKGKEFSSMVEALVSNLHKLSGYRRCANGINDPTRRSVMECERQAWCLLHNIKATIGPLLASQVFGKLRRRMLFDGNNAGTIASIKAKLKKHDDAVEKYLHMLDRAISIRAKAQSHKQSTQHARGTLFDLQPNHLLTSA